MFGSTDSPREFAVKINSVGQSSGFHNWSIEFSTSPESNESATHKVDIDVHWVHSTPVIVIEDQVVPGLGQVSGRYVIYNRGLSGVWKFGDRTGTTTALLESPHKSPHGCHYVIERSGETMHDWWTGSNWTDDWNKAKWYEHEPFAGSKTGDEGAHTVYYPKGVVSN